jgi:hypothetical protein
MLSPILQRSHNALDDIQLDQALPSDKAFSSISVTSSLTGGNALQVSEWVAPSSGGISPNNNLGSHTSRGVGSVTNRI